MTRQRERVLGAEIDVLSWKEAVDSILKWAAGRESRTVCICNVHSAVTADADDGLRDAINGADLATPDGMPLAWLIGMRRRIVQPKISGPDLTELLCREAETRGISVAFYGSTPESLERLQSVLEKRHPALNIACMISPPFRTLSQEENENYAKELNDSGAGIIFVGLGCPKQEVWMASRKDSLQGVLIGVGAAFEFLAGTVKRPPLWMQKMGLEWLGRLVAEPRRLWRRYLTTNSIFVAYVIRELLLGRGKNGNSGGKV